MVGVLHHYPSAVGFLLGVDEETGARAMHALEESLEDSADAKESK